MDKNWYQAILINDGRILKSSKSRNEAVMKC